MSEDIKKLIPETIDYEATVKLLSVDPSPLNVVLLQEVKRKCLCDEITRGYIRQLMWVCTTSICIWLVWLTDTTVQFFVGDHQVPARSAWQGYPRSCCYVNRARRGLHIYLRRSSTSIMAEGGFLVKTLLLYHSVVKSSVTFSYKKELFLHRWELYSYMCL